MTISATTSSQRFHGSDSTGPFTWAWRFLANTDIRAYRIATPDEADPSSEARVLMTEGVDYTLTGAGTYTGGSLTLTTALATGHDLLVKRFTAKTQTIDIRNQGDNFLPEVHEDAFDSHVMMIQDLERETEEAQTINDGLTDRVEALEAATMGASVVPPLIYLKDASAGQVYVDVVAANDPLAREVIVIKSKDDTSDNPVTFRPAAGTVEDLAEVDLVMTSECAIFIPIASENNYYRAS